MVSWPLNLLLIILINGRYECLNTWNKTIGSNGEDIWRSTSSFIPSQSQSYGTIRLGQIINVEFDFIFKGRTNNPRQSYAENFFRIGHNAENGKSCDGDGSRYPSLWLTPGNTNTGYLDISATSGTLCAATYIIYEYGTINIDSLHHIKIEIIHTQITIHISGGNKQNYTQTFNRKPTMKHHINQSVGVWFMSNRFTGTPYNVGNGILSNIIITSNIFTPTLQPTLHPTFQKIVPIFYPTYNNPTTENPTHNPNIITNIPTYQPIPRSHPTTENPTHNPTVHTIMSKPTRSPTPKPLLIILNSSINNSNTNIPSIYPSWNPTTFLTSFLPSNTQNNTYNTYSYNNNFTNNGLNIWATIMATVAIFVVFWTIMVICCVRQIKKYQIKYADRYNTVLTN